MRTTTRTSATHRILRVFDWTLRVVLALFFVYFGWDKFGARPLWIRLFSDIGVSQWFRYATGVIELAGGLLLLVPRTTLIAVPMLGCTMVGAFLAHVFIIGVGAQSVLVGILSAALATIGWRRVVVERSHVAVTKSTISLR